MVEKSDVPDEPDQEPKVDRPGPVDHGRRGGMATRENAPELSQPDHQVPDAK